MPELGVNIDHVGTLRQARKTYEPDPVAAAVLAELGGADAITIHLREDRRHIQDRDVRVLRETVALAAERIELIGTKGSALLEGTALKMQFHDGKSFEFKTDAGGGGTGADPMAFPHDWHRGVLADFLDAIEQGREPRVSGAEALKVHRFIDALLRA